MQVQYLNNVIINLSSMLSNTSSSCITVGTWFEVILNSLLIGNRYDSLVMSGSTAITDIVLYICDMIMNDSIGKCYGLWNSLERLLLGHPDPNVLLIHLPLIKQTFQYILMNTTVLTTTNNNNDTNHRNIYIPSREHDSLCRLLTIMQGWLTLNVCDDVSFEKVWLSTCNHLNCSIQSSVDMIQICRRSSWTNRGTYNINISLRNLLTATDNSSSSSSTLDSQVLTWCSVGNIRDSLKLVPGPGFMNIGNTCYMNSILQILFYTGKRRY
jgi:hypothetical protein